MTWYTHAVTNAALGDGDFEIDHRHLQQNCGYFKAREITSETHSPSLRSWGSSILAWTILSPNHENLIRIWLPSTRHLRKQKPSGSTAASCWRMDGFQCHSSSLGCGIWVQLVTFIHTSAPEKPPPQAPKNSLPWRFHNASDTPPGISPGRTLEMWRWGLPWTGNHNFGIPNGDRVRAENPTTSIRSLPSCSICSNSTSIGSAIIPQTWEKWWKNGIRISEAVSTDKHTMPLGIECSLRQYLRDLALFISTRMLKNIQVSRGPPL